MQVKNIGIPDEFVEQGSQTVLRAKYGLDADGIVHHALSLLPEHLAVAPLKAKGQARTTQFTPISVLPKRELR